MILSIENLHKSYERSPNPVLQGIDLSLDAGEVLAVLGQSGSGKSTLLKSIAGLEAIDQGKIVLDGRVVSSSTAFVPPEQRHVGYLFQDFALFPHLDVAKNVGFGIKDKTTRANRVQEILKLVGMESHLTKYPHELSGGEQQRVALARAMAPNPTLLLLDEPFSNLDVHVKKDIRSFVFSVIRSSGLSCVFVTHDLEDAQEYADTVSVLHAGRIEQSGSPEALYAAPQTSLVAGFFGEINILDGAMLACFDLPAAKGKICAIRLNDIQCSANQREGSRPAKIVSKTHLGHLNKLRVEIFEGGSLELLLPEGSLNGSEHLYISINERDLLLFDK